jgi:hypothetical protein
MRVRDDFFKMRCKATEFIGTVQIFLEKCFKKFYFGKLFGGIVLTKVLKISN